MVELRDLLRRGHHGVQQGGDQQVGLGAGLALLADDSDDGFDDPDAQAPGLALFQAQAGAVPAAGPVMTTWPACRPL